MTQTATHIHIVGSVAMSRLGYNSSWREAVMHDRFRVHSQHERPERPLMSASGHERPERPLMSASGRLTVVRHCVPSGPVMT